MGLLDYLTGNNAAASPWGMLYQQPDAAAPQMTQLQHEQALAALMGGGQSNPLDVLKFGAPPQAPDAASIAPPPPPVDPYAQTQSQHEDALAGMMTAGQKNPLTTLAPGFGPATPFGFAGPGSNVVNPSSIAAPPPPPAFGAGAAPVPFAAGPVTNQPPTGAPTDLSSVNRSPQGAAPGGDDEGPDSTVPIGRGPGSYQMPMLGEPGDAPAAAAPAARPGPAPFSMGGPGLGDRFAKAGTGFLGNMDKGPLGALMAGVGSLVSGRSSDPTTIAGEKMTATAQALVKKGAPIEDVQAAVNNPALMTALIGQYYGKDKWKIVKTGQDGMGAEQYKLMNDQGEFKDIPGAPAGGSPAGIGDMTKRGPEYLATVPTAQRNTLQMMINGDLPPPTSFAMAKPYWQNMISAAKNADPNFSETMWSARVAMQKSAQGDGKLGQNNNALSTGIGHLTQLWDAIPALNNSDHSQTYNRISNAVSTEFGGTGATNFQAVANRVAPEIVKIWRGTGGAEADIKRDIESLNTAQTPSQLRGAISNIAGMMKSKLDSNMEEYKSTMGRDMPMTPKTQAAFAAISKLEQMAGGAAPAGTVTVNGKPTAWSVQ